MSGTSPVWCIAWAKARGRPEPPYGVARCLRAGWFVATRAARREPRSGNLCQGSVRLGSSKFHDERRRRRAELVKHLHVVDDRVLLHARRLLRFLHVASANRSVCKTGIGACPFRADLLIELRQP
jgi:hypothetical protein